MPKMIRCYIVVRFSIRIWIPLSSWVSYPWRSESRFKRAAKLILNTNPFDEIRNQNRCGLEIHILHSVFKMKFGIASIIGRRKLFPSCMTGQKYQQLLNSNIHMWRSSVFSELILIKKLSIYYPQFMKPSLTWTHMVSLLFPCLFQNKIAIVKVSTLNLASNLFDQFTF